ncbi:MAG: copper(I)-binding protein [Granulosicoccus sp.]|jgi:copper(I)-binding protein
MNSIIKGSLAAVLLTSLSLANAKPPEFSAALIIQPPPGAKVAAAYFTVRNNSSEPFEITGASSEAIEKVSIHLSTIVDDVAKMIHQDSVMIEAGSSLEFKHGSYHLMLIGLKAPLIPGSMLAFEIETSAGIVPIMIPIITPDEASSMKSHSMNHDSMKMEKDPTAGDHGHSDEDIKHEKKDASKSMDKN